MDRRNFVKATGMSLGALLISEGISAFSNEISGGKLSFHDKVFATMLFRKNGNKMVDSKTTIGIEIF